MADRDRGGEPEGDTFDVEDVLSERTMRLDDGSCVVQYLIKWDNYPMDECTWEPQEHLEGTDLLQKWAKNRRDLGEHEFQSKMAENEEEFNKAVHDRDRKRRQRRERTERGRPLVADDNKSEEDASLMVQKRTSKQRSLSPRTALANREAIDNSQLNSLFVDSQDVQSPSPAPTLGQAEENPLVRHPLVNRKPPLQQSESSLSEGEVDENVETSDDSLMEELQERAKEIEKKKKGKTPESSKNPVKTSAALLKPKSSAKQSEPKAQVKKVLPKPLDSYAATAQTGTDFGKKIQRPIQSAVHKTAFTQRNTSNLASTTSSAATNPATSTRTPSVPRSTLKNRRTSSTALASIKRTAPGSKPAGGIRIVNQPKSHPKPWSKSNKQYSTLQFRRIAENRSRTEGTPELGALDFVHGSPAGLPKVRTQAPNDNPYGRREPGNRRLQEEDVEDTPRRGSVDAAVPLENWETEKIPLVCPQFRLSNNCIYGPLKCRYMHRDKDASGRDYPVGDINGWLPPKYRPRPFTCWYWLEGFTGCRWTDDECQYAHSNTGWLPPSNAHPNEPKQIDRSRTPLSEQMVRRPSQPEIAPMDKKKMKPSDLTCVFWTEGTCRKTADNCTHQHHHTGIVADLPPNTRHNQTRILPRQTDNEPKSAVALPVPGLPNNQRGRKALPRADAPVDAEHPRPPPPPPLVPKELPPAKTTCSQLNSDIEKACKLDFTYMFTSNERESMSEPERMLERRAFLIYHPIEHAEELEIITRWLLMHHVEIGSAWFDGSWDYFKQQIFNGRSGIIIVHPAFEDFTELPDFGRVLLGKQVRLWCVGLQEHIQYEPHVSKEPPEFQYDCIEIFGLGGFIYITDDVFEKKPQLALKIVELFFAKIKVLQRLDGPTSWWHEVDDALLLWRLCVRPELMQYLYQHCEDHAEELDAGDPDVQSRARLYEILSETKYIEQDDPTVPFSLVDDKYPIISERGWVAEGEPLDYFKRRARSQEEANRYMINYFAAVQFDKRRDYRHFYVVHTKPLAPCVEHWKQELQTLAVVMSPEKCVEELEKAGEESLIDFCERAMPEKE